MKLKCDRDKALKIAFWFCFVVLICLSYFFIEGVWSDYINKRSNFSTDEIPIDKHPSITMCFDNLVCIENHNSLAKWKCFNGQNEKVWNRRMYKLGTEMNITYFVKNKGLSLTLKEGENLSPDLEDEVIHLRRMQSCYMITSKINRPDVQLKRDTRAIRLDFDPNLENDELPEFTNFYFTSEPNAFGIESKVFLEGEPYKVEVERNIKHPWDLCK